MAFRCQTVISLSLWTDGVAVDDAPGIEESKASWVTSVLTGAPLPGILLGVGRSVFNLFSRWLSHKRQERALKRNGLTYLLQIQRAHA